MYAMCVKFDFTECHAHPVTSDHKPERGIALRASLSAREKFLAS
jgi:hypothetical protein